MKTLLPATLLTSVFAALFLAVCGDATAQNSDFNLSVHAHDHATAADTGLPQYPGSVILKKTDGDSESADLGFAFGDTSFVLRVATFQTHDSADKVLAFYRKPLSRYGEVVECNHRKPVGSPTATSSGLTCSDQNGGGVHVNGSNSSDDHELRAGSPQHFRIASAKPENGAVTISLVYVELPRDSKK